MAPESTKAQSLWARIVMRDDGHDIPSVQGIGKFYKRHTMSSSRGTRSTEGIFSGAMARALSSTSFPESPTATSVSFTTATYLPGVFGHQLTEMLDNPEIVFIHDGLPWQFKSIRLW